MTVLDKILYTGKTRTVGGREGHARSDDGQLDIALSSPGSGLPGSNPEQLFAAGWSACFEGAMAIAARKLKIAMPADAAIDAIILARSAGRLCAANPQRAFVDAGISRSVCLAVFEYAAKFHGWLSFQRREPLLECHDEIA